MVDMITDDRLVGVVNTLEAEAHPFKPQNFYSF